MAITTAWGAVFSIKRFIDHYLENPAADDFRVYYYAAKLGLQQGWDHLYNQAALRAVMAAHFSGSEAVIDGGHTYPNLPPLAWMIAPLTVLSFGPAYAAWALIGLSSVVVAWALACPFRGLARITLLLLAVAIWPIHYSIFFGQPTPEILALVAAAWWFLNRNQRLAAGVALALATSLKPQDLILVPFALLVSRRVGVFVWWAACCAVLGLIFFAAIGVHGAADFWQTTVVVESYPGHKILTMASLVGPGLPAAGLQAISAIAVLFGAWRRRSSLELVIALGLVGSVATAVHAHESDFAVLVLAGWLVLRSPIGVSTRLWLLPGIAAVQAMSIGMALPVLLWELVWIGLLLADRTHTTNYADRRLQVSAARG
ncbi:MAG TPA: glycosyltransferase family 87 protein [Candidatus Dormibacteraeota bacterium]|nr:glycosyltransferase family 87 protein [Candidatus Dormibacteraeota bacterium]